MNHLLQDYLAYIAQLQQRVTKQQTYFHKFDSGAQILQQIEKQQKEIHQLIASLKEKESLKAQIQAVKSNLIPDHYLFSTVRMEEFYTEREKDIKWNEYLQPNHEINIHVIIQEIMPILKSIDINPNPITFDSLRFHMYHADESCKTHILNYHPRYNLYRQGQIIQGKMLKGDRRVHLKLKHQIRPQNIELYRGLFEEIPLKIVAQASYGLILGIADIYIGDLSEQNKPIQDLYRCIVFKNPEFQENGFIVSTQKTLIGKIRISIDSSPLAPLLEDLKQNAQIQIKKRPTSKSKSPNRLISNSPSRAVSPKRKRKMLDDLSSTDKEIIYLTVFQGVQYRYNLGSTGIKREITYRQLKNIKQRKVELVKIQQNYYFKCYLIRDNPLQKAYIHFQLNQQKYIVYAITDKLYKIIDFPTYFRAKDKKTILYNKMIRISDRALVCPRENTRVLKNIIKQGTVDGILSSIFIKTVFDQCQIFVQAPFIIEDIAHKEGGYMIGYYYSSCHPLEVDLQTSLIFFLKSRFKQTNEIHIFDCTVTPRIAARDTVYKQLRINQNESFYRISLSMMANQNVEYQIRSTSLSINIINGKNYQFSAHNQDVLLQITSPLQNWTSFDIVFTDSKLRCFFMRVGVLFQEDEQQQIRQKKKM